MLFLTILDKSEKKLQKKYAPSLVSIVISHILEPSVWGHYNTL